MSSSEIAISVEDLSKRYTITQKAERAHGPKSFRESIRAKASRAGGRGLDLLRGRTSSTHGDVAQFWALKDVSFEVKRGEVIGIIGRNGAGKSTLLKVLSRITEPTAGRVRIRGRVASLLEVGTGFHPELTGRENIFLNGAILGMSRQEIRARFDEIVAFAETEKFLDTPVKRYSSGMYVRLAFAVAAHIDPEILIVDEVLAVGDIGFQRKCLGKMKEVAGSHGRTVLFVSHSMPAIEQLCSSGLMLADGRVEVRGSVAETIARYISSTLALAAQSLRSRSDRQGDARLRVVHVTLHDDDGVEVAAATCGKPLRIRLHYESPQATGCEAAVDAAFTMRNGGGVLLTCFANVQTGAGRLPIHPAGYFECRVPKMNLRSGSYVSTLFVSLDGAISDWVQDAFQVLVEDGNFFGTGHLVSRDHGDLVLDQSWTSTATAQSVRIA